jgi:hypothetical protein
VSASSFGEFTSVSPGSWIEIYGSNLAVDTRSWLASDFNGFNAPTSLDGTSVTIGGQAAFIDFISPGQVNALVPSNVATGTQPMTVTVGGVTSTAYNINVNPVQPGLDAPASFNIGGTQYVVALFADGTYVLPTGRDCGPHFAARPAGRRDRSIRHRLRTGHAEPTGGSACAAGQYADVDPRYVRRRGARHRLALFGIGAGVHGFVSVQCRGAGQRRQRRSAVDVHGRRRRRNADAVSRGGQLGSIRASMA